MEPREGRREGGEQNNPNETLRWGEVGVGVWRVDKEEERGWKKRVMNGKR